MPRYMRIGLIVVGIVVARLFGISWWLVIGGAFLTLAFFGTLMERNERKQTAFDARERQRKDDAIRDDEMRRRGLD